MKTLKNITILFSICFSSFAFAGESHCFEKARYSNEGLPSRICINTVVINTVGKNLQTMNIMGPNLNLAFKEVMKMTNSDYALASTSVSKSKKAIMNLAFVPEYDSMLKQWTIGKWDKVRLEIVYKAYTDTCMNSDGCNSSVAYQIVK